MLAESPAMVPASPGRAHDLLRFCLRYGLSTVGPVAVSLAHFVASLLFLRLLGPAEFGQFSFVLIVVPFCLSAAGALLGAPAALTRSKDEAVARAEIVVLHKASLVISMLAGIVVTGLMISTRAEIWTAAMFGLYAAAFTLRSFGRSLSNVHGKLLRVAASDLVYGGLVVGGLSTVVLAGALTMSRAAFVLAGAAAMAFLPFGWDYGRDLIRAAGTEALLRYRSIWRDVSRWSLVGVVLTELTTNAHAYLVTFMAGPRAFGLLALGALLMRPASLVLGALPDIDQPVMTRRIAQRDVRGAFRVVNEFRTAAGAVLAGTMVLSAVVLMWFPQLLLKKGYDQADVLVVLAFWVAITALRVLRTPEAVFVQATGNYPALARISAWSSVAALSVTFALLWFLGPIISLGGVLAGEVVITLMLFPLTNRWRARRG